MLPRHTNDPQLRIPSSDVCGLPEVERRDGGERLAFVLSGRQVVHGVRRGDDGKVAPELVLYKLVEVVLVVMRE